MTVFHDVKALIKIINGLKTSADSIVLDVILYSRNGQPLQFPEKFYILPLAKQRIILNIIDKAI